MSTSNNRKSRSATPRSVRMDDVARKANVSRMTVSRALSNPDLVSNKTLQKILLAIEKTGYIPNRLAGNLTSNRSNTIALILPSIKNAIFSATIQAAADTLSKRDYLLLIADSGHQLEEEEKLVAAFLGQRVSGIIMHNTVHSKRTISLISNSGIPVVETGDLVKSPLDSVVSYSNFEAAKAMTLSLAARGYKRIAFVYLPSRLNNRAKLRRRGYLAALRKLQIEKDDSIMIDTGLSLKAGGGDLEAGREALLKLLQLRQPPEVIFFAGDIMAAGAVFECQRRKLSIPEEIAIASFDDLNIMQFMSPSVTSLQIPRLEIGREAASYILKRLGGETTPLVSDLGFKIVHREST